MLDGSHGDGIVVRVRGWRHDGARARWSAVQACRGGAHSTDVERVCYVTVSYRARVASRTSGRGGGWRASDGPRRSASLRHRRRCRARLRPILPRYSSYHLLIHLSGIMRTAVQIIRIRLVSLIFVGGVPLFINRGTSREGRWVPGSV